MEIWEDVKYYEGIYEVSSFGRIRNKRKQILSPFKTHNGYKMATLCRGGICIKRYVHRLVAIAFKENPENKPEVNHKNHIKTDNYVDNLEWCTPSENRRHMLEAKRSKQQCCTLLTCINTNDEFEFYSNGAASKFLNRHKDYVSKRLRDKIYIAEDKAGKHYRIDIV